MLKAIFLAAIATLILATIRSRSAGNLPAGLRGIAGAWRRYTHPQSDVLFERLAQTWPCLVAISPFLAAAYARSSYGVLTGDGFAWIDQSRRLDLSNASSFVHPFYNLGWPAVLRLGSEIGLAEVQTARIASVWFASLAVLCTCLITRQATSSRIFVWSVLSATPALASYAALGSTDLPAAAIQLAAIWLAVRPRGSMPLATGLLIGIAFLFRHQALLLALPLAAITIARQEHPFRRIALFAAGVIIGSAPQLIANFLATTNPLSSEQTKNLLFGLAGGGRTRDWSRFPTGPAPTLISLLLAPGLLKHTLTELFSIDSVWQSILLALASLTISMRRWMRVSLIALAVAYSTPLAAAWIEPRFILVATASLSFLDGYWIATLSLLARSTILSFTSKYSRLMFLPEYLTLLILLAQLFHPLITHPYDPKKSLYDGVSTCLQRVDTTDPDSILTLSPVLTDVRLQRPSRHFVIPPLTDGWRAVELLEDRRIHVILLAGDALPTDPSAKAAAKLILASEFTESCHAQSADSSLQATVLVRNGPTTRPPEEPLK